MATGAFDHVFPIHPHFRRLIVLSFAILLALALLAWAAVSARAQSLDPTYSLQTTLPLAATAHSAATGDFNNDGNLDLVVGMDGQNALYLNDGHGNFDAPIPFGDPAHTVDLGLGDLDNNGTLDVIAYNFGSPSALYANSGAGVFTRIQTFAAATDPADRLAVGDLDGDGDYDLVTAQKAGMTIVYMNNGQGALQQTRTLPAGLKPVLQDVDANGALDIVLIRPDSSEPT